MTGVVVALVVIVAAIAFYAERQAHPWRKCPRCNGSGRVNRLSSPRETWAVCGRCHGKKEIRRAFARKQ